MVFIDCPAWNEEKKKMLRQKKDFFTLPQRPQGIFKDAPDAPRPPQKNRGWVWRLYILGFSETQNLSKVHGAYNEW